MSIVVGIVLLIIVALVAVLTRSPQNEDYVADDTPQGVVHDYFLAIQRKDYDRAYSYLSDDLKSKPDLNQFIRDIGNTSEASLKIGEIRTGDVHTQVDVSAACLKAAATPTGIPPFCALQMMAGN